jgi:TatD DNase family protein
MYLNFHTHYSKKPEEEIFNLDSAEDHYETYFSYGIHPFSEQTTLDEKLFLNTKCLAVGETGLDKLSAKDLSEQITLFKQHIHFSEKYELPVIIHCVKAWNEVKQVTKELKPKQTWIFHSFRKTAILKEVLDHQLYIGIGPAILYDEKLQNALKIIPLNQLLLETDDNEIDIIQVYEKVAEIKNIDLSALTSAINTNFSKIFTRYK